MTISDAEYIRLTELSSLMREYRKILKLMEETFSNIRNAFRESGDIKEIHNTLERLKREGLELLADVNDILIGE